MNATPAAPDAAGRKAGAGPEGPRSISGRLAGAGLIGCVLLAATPAGHGAPLRIENLRCEYRVDPAGIDVREPRLSWEIRGNQRGQRQSAFRVWVADNEAALRGDHGTLWDSGKVASDQTLQVVYRGQPLRSRQRCWWKVRVWDQDDRPSASSPVGRWTTGLLERSDWQARWIADPGQLAQQPARRPHNGYHSELVHSADTTKWVVIDLGQTAVVDTVRLFPARPYDWQPDTPGFLFPVRFKIEVASRPDLSDAQVVADRTAGDEPSPGTNAPAFTFPGATARFVRLAATRLRRRDADNYGLAFAEAQVLAEGRNLAQGAAVTALDSIEAGGWAKANATDGVLGTVAPGAIAALPATMLRKDFALPAGARKATAYVTALGLYELYLNGRRVGDQLLAPEWTNYRKRVQYQTCDLTPFLRPGLNTVGAILGEGWYAGRLMAVGRNAYGSQPRFLCQLEFEWADGQRQTIVTDSSWRATSGGPIRSAGIYDGEVYDARLELPGWASPGFDERAWRPAESFDLGAAELVWQPNEPIRVVKELRPVQLTQPKPGVYVFDFGQNIVGWCRVNARGQAGAPITLRHAEMLNDDGAVYTANLRGAPQIDRCIPGDTGSVIFEPRFTYHGFRYLEMTGLTRPPRLDSVVGRVFHSASPEISRFESSSPLLNQLMRNILWTQRANLMSSPNDCPQRDERFGWMGDIQAFSQSAIFNMDLGAFFFKWCRDIRDDQADDGRYPDFAPHPGNPNLSFSGVPAWGDAGTVVPWRAFQNYADTRLLEQHFESACRWIEYIRGLNPDLVWAKGRNNDYNDWLNGDWVRQAGWPTKGASVPQEIFATAFFAHSTALVAKMAAVLGRNEHAAHYGRLFDQIKTAFNQRFVEPNGRIQGDTQAGYALALEFDLLPDSLRAAAVNHLLEGIARYHGHLSTGIQTTHRLMLALSRNGHHDEACRLVNLRDFPSWGYMIENGATTMWERWDGYVKGRGFQDAGMNSFNHWAFGAVAEWVWRCLAGLNPDESAPGWKHFTIAPQPGGGLTWVRAEYESIRGRIASHWGLEGGRFKLDVTIPPNTTATVRVPASDPRHVREGGRLASAAVGVKLVDVEKTAAVFRVGSGTYSFEAPMSAAKGQK